VRSDLVAALLSYAERQRQSGVGRFLLGLSCDELQFLAEFLGASILESSKTLAYSRAELAQRIAEFQTGRSREVPTPDQDHKMILLLEFLCRSGMQFVPARASASHA
jgi:hypothetical protein